MSRLIALVPAAGRGDRFGGAVAKQFVEMGGRPLLLRTLERLLEFGVDRVVVALPETGFPKSVLPADPRVLAVPGGATRQASVIACLRAAGGEDGDLILVHDGARPAVHPDDLRAVCTAALHAGGAVLGRRVADTLKRVEDGRVLETVDRAGLFRAETPQVFHYQILERACSAALRDAFEGTDESSLVERLDGVTIAAVQASHPNPKLTAPADWPLLATLLAAS